MEGRFYPGLTAISPDRRNLHPLQYLSTSRWQVFLFFGNRFLATPFTVSTQIPPLAASARPCVPPDAFLYLASVILGYRLAHQGKAKENAHDK